MQNCKELINRINREDNTDDEWKQIKNDIIKFLDEDHPKEEKDMFYPFGYLEMVNMLCNEE